MGFTPVYVCVSRAVPAFGGCDSTLQEALYHGREDRPAQLRPFRLAGEAAAADPQVPPHGGDRLPGVGHAGEPQTRTLNLKSSSMEFCSRTRVLTT